MEKALVLAQVIGPIYLLLGLSVLLYAKSWQRLVSKFENDHDSLFTIMLMYAVLGMIVVNMYNVWAWNVWLLVTLTGWVLLVKSVFFFLMPGPIIKKWLAMKKNMNLLYVGGLVCIAMGAALSYYTYFA